MSLYKGTTLLAGVATNTIANAHSLFDYKWTDHLLNEMGWLRADTFSWQDGTVYSEVYNHLVDDYTNGTVMSETVDSWTINYILAADGHKITTDEETAEYIYEESGVAWYYILDMDNQSFKLPRENPAREELVNYGKIVSTGAAIKLSQLDGNANYVMYQKQNSSQFYLSMTNTSGEPYATATQVMFSPRDVDLGIKTDLINSTSIYKGKKYLYFYVGQFSQSATEQTAGLNSSLFNGKVDLDAANLSTDGKSLISGLPMPSSTSETLTLGASGTTYTATKNGYFFFGRAATAAGQYIDLYNTTTGFRLQTQAVGNGSYCLVTIPATKGDIVQVNYSVAGSSLGLKFILAKGET